MKKERASFGSNGLYGEVVTGNSGVGTLQSQDTASLRNSHPY